MKRKIVYKIIAIMLIIIIFFPYTTITFAATVEEVGNAIATFANSYYEKTQTEQVPYGFHPKNAGYPSGWMSKRAIPASGTPVKNPYPSYANFDHYSLDCVGWVNFCVFNATGITYASVTDGSGGYVTPQSGVRDTEHFQSVTGPAQPGDILRSGSHVLICVKPGEGLEMNSKDYTGGNLKGPFVTHSISSYSVVRIKESAASQIDSSTLVTDPSISAGGNTTSLFGNNQNESEFYYNGIPDGKYSVAGNFWDWIVESLLSIAKFVINIITYIIRMVFVGWTAIMENLITYAVESVTNEKALLDVDATNAETNDNITIETIVFNKVRAFDVNFFNMDS
ncbi:MAG: hypothetical protein ACI4UE_05235 [Candidatus Scatovivens sp.]